MIASNSTRRRVSRLIVPGVVAACASAWWSADASAQSVIDMPTPPRQIVSETTAEAPRESVDAGRLAIARFAGARSGPTGTYGMYDQSYRYGSYGFSNYGYGIYPWGYYPWYGGCFPHAHVVHVGGGRFVGHLHH